jgi:hypothetical protein
MQTNFSFKPIITTLLFMSINKIMRVFYINSFNFSPYINFHKIMNEKYFLFIILQKFRHSYILYNFALHIINQTN